MHPATTRATLALAFMIGCSTDNTAKQADVGTTDPTGTTATAESTPAPALDDLPAALTDAPIEGAHNAPPIRYNPDRHDALTARADCTSLVSACLAATDGDFQTCVASAPTCDDPTVLPSAAAPCCPEACADTFADAVSAGAHPADAYVRTFAIDPVCFSGWEGL